MTDDQADVIIAKKNEIITFLIEELKKVFDTNGKYRPDSELGGLISENFNVYVKGLVKND